MSDVPQRRLARGAKALIKKPPVYVAEMSALFIKLQMKRQERKASAATLVTFMHALQ